MLTWLSLSSYLFHACIRTGELLALRTSQMFVDHAGNIILALGRSMTGKRRGEDAFGTVDSGPVASIIAVSLSQHSWDQPLVGRQPHC